MMLLFDPLNDGLSGGPWGVSGGFLGGVGAMWHWSGDHPSPPNGVLGWVVAYGGDLMQMFFGENLPKGYRK